MKKKRTIDYTKNLENFFNYYVDKYKLNADISVLQDPEICKHFEGLLEDARKAYSDRQKLVQKKAEESRKASGYYQSETHKNACVNGGKVAGRISVENGHLDRIRDPKKANEASLERIVCEVCNRDANTGNYARWHGKKCMWNDVQLLLNNLSVEFTWKQSKQVSKQLFGSDKIAWKVVMNGYEDLIEKIYQGTNGSSKDVSIYRKKDIAG